MKFYVTLTWSDTTAERLRQQGVSIPWPESTEVKVPCERPPLKIEDISYWIESKVESIYYRQMQGQDEGQAQITSIRAPNGNELPWGAWTEPASRHLKDGDAIVVGCEFAASSMFRAQEPSYTDEDLDRIRADLRFDNNDRVVCFIGPRWVSGLVVGTAVVDEGEVLPYLVKTDPLPGLPGRTISVPMDSDRICVQEVCFNPKTELHLVQAAAQVLKESARPKLRFAVGDKVVVRVRNSAEDGLENWVSGTVSSVWPKIGGEAKWQIGDMTGSFPDAVPYRVDLAGGKWVFCHKDHFTLVRREGLQPQTRTKHISKRMEVVEAADGSTEKIDHQTERRKRVSKNLEGDSD